MTPEDAVISTLRPKQAAPRQEGSPGPVIFHVLTTVLRALGWNGPLGLLPGTELLLGQSLLWPLKRTCFYLPV